MELTKIKRESATFSAGRAHPKGEILAIARILRRETRHRDHQTAASGEYCFNSGLGTMVHFATQPERTPEDVVYEFDASGLLRQASNVADATATRTRPNDAGRLYFCQRDSQTRITARAMPTPRSRLR